MPRVPAFFQFVALITLVAPLTLACGQPGPSAPQAPAATQPPAAKPPEAPAVASPVSKPAAQASPSPAAAAAKPAAGPTGGTFVIASLGPLPNTLHPYPDSAAYTNAWTDVAILIWDAGLLDQDANSLEYVPYMASEWNVSADGKTFTFKLRDGLKWSDGQPITVDDFVFAWQNASKEENDFVGLDDLKRVDSFTAPGPKTIVVTLKETLARDIAIGVANSIGPVPKHVWQGKEWNDPAANPEILKPSVVSGPYLLKDWNAAEGATFVRNPNWFRGQANFDQVVLKPGQQPTVAYELLKSGQAHWAPNIPPSRPVPAGPGQSRNWSGYEAIGGEFTAVTGSWRRAYVTA